MKKVLAQILALAMVLCMVPAFGAFAADSITATETGTTSITVEWTAVDDAVKYFLKVEGEDFSKVIGTEDTTATVEGLKANTAYAFSINVKSGAGKYTGYGEAAQFTTNGAPVIECADPALSTMELTWDAVEGATKYYISVVSDSVSKVLTSETNTLLVKGLDPSTEYTFALNVKLGTGVYTGYGEAVTFETDAPSKLTAVKKGNDLGLNWNSLEHVDRIWLKGTRNGETKQFAAITDVDVTSLDYKNFYSKIANADEYEFFLISRVIEDGATSYIVSNAVVAEVAEAAATVEDINAAIANAEKEANIYLTADVALTDANITIPKGKDVTINLNGKTISAVATSAKASNLFHVKGGAALTLTGDGVVSYRATKPDTDWGEGSTNAYPGYANNTIRNEGKLVVDGATLYNWTERGGASYVIDCYSGSSLTVEAGHIEQKGDDVAIRTFANGAVNVTINNGEILGCRAIWVHLPSNNANVAPTVNVTINGGTLTSTRANSAQPVIYVYTYGNSLANTKLVINGGTFLGSYIGLDGGVRNGTASVIDINGGNFEQPVWRYTDSDTILVYDANM